MGKTRNGYIRGPALRENTRGKRWFGHHDMYRGKMMGILGEGY